MYTYNSNKNAGFTLVEMLMVILIIAATTKIVAVSMEDFGFAARYEHTISRLDTIRQAIIGNPKRTVNGQPDISGFVVDMGRLPRNLRELLDQSYCIPDRRIDEQDYNTATYASAQLHCNAAYGANSWEEARDYSACSDAQYIDESNCEANSELWYPFKSGWNGPYISIRDNILDADAFTDGWGREAQSNTDFDYGWSSCRWNNGADTANSATANNMPDDTDGTLDGLPNCITAYGTVNQNLTLYSLGKGGTGDIAADGSVTCGANEYDGDCYANILDEDYKIDVSNGIDIAIKAGYQPGVCHYVQTQAPTHSDKNACINLGGATGICRKTSFNPPNCEANNLVSDNDLDWCLDFKQQTSTGTAAADCGFTSSGADATEKWGVCVDVVKTTQASCNETNDVWWETQNWCIDKSKSNDSATTCPAGSGAGSPALTLKTDFCQYSNDVSCQAGGGDWENCIFSPDASLTTSTPVAVTMACKITVKSCEQSALGTWNYANGNCTIDDQQPCLAAGGTWTTSCNINSDGVASEGECQAIGGSWQGIFPQSSSSCTGTGKTWHSNSNYCEFSNAQCNATNGGGQYRTTGVCRRSHSDITASTLTQAICESYGGQEWVTEKKQICMNLFYRNPADSSFSRIQSYPVTIDLDGSYQNIHFSLPNFGVDPVLQAECEDEDGFNDGEWDSTAPAHCRFNVAQGINAIGVFEYDGDCDPTTGNSFYPNNRTEPLALQFIPQASLPIINW